MKDFFALVIVFMIIGFCYLVLSRLQVFDSDMSYLKKAREADIVYAPDISF